MWRSRRVATNDEHNHLNGVVFTIVSLLSKRFIDASFRTRHESCLLYGEATTKSLKHQKSPKRLKLTYNNNKKKKKPKKQTKTPFESTPLSILLFVIYIRIFTHHSTSRYTAVPFRLRGATSLTLFGTIFFVFVICLLLTPIHFTLELLTLSYSVFQLSATTSHKAHTRGTDNKGLG